jgi:hypothetical protein
VVRESAIVLERSPICERVKVGQVARLDALLQLPDALARICRLPPLHAKRELKSFRIENRNQEFLENEL